MGIGMGMGMAMGGFVRTRASSTNDALQLICLHPYDLFDHLVLVIHQRKKEQKEVVKKKRKIGRGEKKETKRRK